MDITRKQIMRFYDKREIHPKTGCWIWTGSINEYGYGKLRVGRAHIGSARMEYTHRISYYLAHGDITDGLVIRHICDIRQCYNPDHLMIGTHQDNVNDRQYRGRHAHGERHQNSVLHDADIPDIDMMRYSKGMYAREIAEVYGVSAGAIQRALERISWKHIPLPPEALTWDSYQTRRKRKDVIQ